MFTFDYKGTTIEVVSNWNKHIDGYLVGFYIGDVVDEDGIIPLRTTYFHGKSFAGRLQSDMTEKVIAQINDNNYPVK